MGKKAGWLNIIAMIGAVTAKAAPVLAMTPAAPVVMGILIATNIVAQLTPGVTTEVVKVNEPVIAATPVAKTDIPVGDIKQ